MRIESRFTRRQGEPHAWDAYDAPKDRDNVAWCFSEPMDVPRDPKIRLDRRTTYQAGSVGEDIGPVSMGAFNQTMHSFGRDRRFRGEIRNLQLFGSRAGNRGAFDIEAVIQRAKAASEWPWIDNMNA